jgi:hypothetical protein
MHLLSIISLSPRHEHELRHGMGFGDDEICFAPDACVSGEMNIEHLNSVFWSSWTLTLSNLLTDMI